MRTQSPSRSHRREVVENHDNHNTIGHLHHHHRPHRPRLHPLHLHRLLNVVLLRMNILIPSENRNNEKVEWCGKNGQIDNLIL